MSERYTRVFSLPENLYAAGSPAVIAAGALLKDNQTGKVLAQLKLTNIQYKKIKAVKVKLFPLDTMGQSLGEAIDYQYLDLQLTRDGDFGAKTPIPFPDATTRAFDAEVTSVVFSDNTAWNSDGTSWEPIPDRVALHQKYDNLVIEQLRLEQSGTCQFVVQEHQDLWLCTCGAVNHDGEVRCHDCGKQLSQIHPLDAAGLMERANARLAEEARLAAEEEATKAAAAVAAKKKTAKILKIVIPAVCAIIAVTLLTTKVIIPNSNYNKAVSLMDAGQYKEAIAAFETLDGYKDSAEQIVKCRDAIDAAEQARIEAEMAAQYAEAEAFADSGKLDKAAIAFAKLGNYLDAHNKSVDLRNSYHKRRFSILAEGYNHVVTINADGTLWYNGDNEHGQCNVADWKNIVSIHAGIFHTVGLTSDGTALATGYQEDGRCNVSNWTNVFDLDAGYYHTVALFMDGTVEVVGKNKYGEGNVSEWDDIIAVSAGGYHTVGLKGDGTVVATGYNKDGQCDVSAWSDIVAIGAGELQTIGLKSDGTVISTGYSDDGRCDVSNWTDIIAIYAGNLHTVGLKADGSVMVAGYNKYGECNIRDWKDMTAICAGWCQTVGLTSDGTTIAAGTDQYGACKVNNWKNTAATE